MSGMSINTYEHHHNVSDTGKSSMYLIGVETDNVTHTITKFYKCVYCGFKMQVKLKDPLYRFVK